MIKLSPPKQATDKDLIRESGCGEEAQEMRRSPETPARYIAQNVLVHGVCYQLCFINYICVLYTLYVCSGLKRDNKGKIKMLRGKC